MEASLDMVDTQANSADQTEGPEATSGSKRPYETPDLVEWGSILDLTRGPLGGFDDPDAGSSQQV
ncbi:MAG TPA: hypothetical protein VH988_31225 [Thermoanaerobaculia bacterium]|jgi:hypothetical protein|nr:hypothetical protein [Thermoanaerobaculia bacterium]